MVTTSKSMHREVQISHKVPAPSDHLDVAMITSGKNYINTARFLTQAAHFVS